MASSGKLPFTDGESRSRPAARHSRRTPPGLVSPDSTQPDLFDYVPPFRRTRLDPEEAPLLLVTTRAFSDREKDDGWLYCLTSAEAGEALLLDGLPLNARHPLLLCARPAVLALLIDHAQTEDGVQVVLLRVRQAHVAPWLENDPDMSARLGASCYLLSRQIPLG